MADEYQPTEHEIFLRKYTTDDHGRNVICGLTYEETVWYRDYQAKDWKYRTSDNYFPWESLDHKHKETRKWLDLENRHEKARFEALGAEHILRTDKPPIN